MAEKQVVVTGMHCHVVGNVVQYTAGCWWQLIVKSSTVCHQSLCKISHSISEVNVSIHFGWVTFYTTSISLLPSGSCDHLPNMIFFQPKHLEVQPCLLGQRKCRPSSICLGKITISNDGQFSNIHLLLVGVGAMGGGCFFLGLVNSII